MRTTRGPLAPARVLTAAFLLVCCAARLSAADLPAPHLLAPRDHLHMTDIASYFQWTAVPQCHEYELQIARDAGFQDLVRSRRAADAHYHEHAYFPKDVLPPGSYVWRVRACAGEQVGDWSAVFAVTVSGDRSVAADPVRTIDPQHPLFLMRNRAWDPRSGAAHLKEIIPDACAGVIVPDDISIGTGDDEAIAKARAYDQLGVDFVVWNNRAQVSLATLEYLFQNFHHCLGTAEGEHFWSWDWERGPEGNISEWDYVPRAWTLCAKYGRLYFIGDGEAADYRWTLVAQRFSAELQRYHRHIVPMFKSTVGQVALHSLGAVEGLMAAGWVDNCGYWADEFAWGESGYGDTGEVLPKSEPSDARCPFSYDLQMWLMGIASGATVFHLESAHQWTESGAGADNYRRYYLPFITAVVAHGLLPARPALLESLKVAVACDLERAAHPHHGSYDPDFAFLGGLYRLRRTPFQELIPDTGRYGIIALLPPGAACLNPKTQVIPQERLLAPGAAAAAFTRAYPERAPGDAFTWTCDGTFIITNCHENEEGAQAFALPLERAPATRISGTAGLHQYVIGKVAADGRSLWLQANGGFASHARPGPEEKRRLTLVFECGGRPRVKVVPEGALVEGVWDEGRGRYALTVDMKEGAVECEVGK